MASLNSISTPVTTPTKTQTIEKAERDLAASVAMLDALRSYIVAVDEASDSDFVDLHDFSCAMQTLLEVAAEATDRARKSVHAALVVVPMPEGGAE